MVIASITSTTGACDIAPNAMLGEGMSWLILLSTARFFATMKSALPFWGVGRAVNRCGDCGSSIDDTRQEYRWAALS